MSKMDEKRFLETSRGVLDYITIDLINQVERHPVLWDRLHQDYKNGEPKIEAWHTIGRVFVPFYDDIDADEQQNITESLKNRWRNCVSGLMSSVTMKRKKDRLFRPFKYTREMEFYLKMRGMKLSDIFDEQENDDEIEETQVKQESEEEEEEQVEDETELEEEHEEETKTVEASPKNKNNKSANTSITFRSARLREKQTALEKSSPESKISTPKITNKKSSPKKKANTPKNTKLQQIKTTPVSINSSNVNHSLEENEITETVEENNEEEHISYNYSPQPKKPKTSSAVNHSVNIIQNSQQPITFANESEAADQAFFESIKPALRKMNETQKLDFQIDILQILKSFRTN